MYTRASGNQRTTLGVSSTSFEEKVSHCTGAQLGRNCLVIKSQVASCHILLSAGTTGAHTTFGIFTWLLRVDLDSSCLQGKSADS